MLKLSLDGQMNLRQIRLLSGIILALFFILSVLALLTYYDRDRPPENLREKAWISIKEARKGQAIRYAPELLREAERDYRNGLSLLERESVRMYFLRNFEGSRSLFRIAIEKAERAMELSKGYRESLRALAEDHLRRARSHAEKIDEWQRIVPINPIGSLKWSRAKMALHEAEIYYETGEFMKAAEKAESAIDSLRDLQEGFFQMTKRFIDHRELKKWSRWIKETIEYSRKKKTSAIIVDKLQHALILYKNGKKVKSFKADLGPNFINEKYYDGDNATPEGKYKIIKKKGKGKTKYYKALLLNYPNQEDKRKFFEAKRKGSIPPYTGIGGMIEIHGEGGKEADWTQGCIALSNKDMDELFRQVRVTTPVTIVGSIDLNKEFASLIRGDDGVDRGKK